MGFERRQEGQLCHLPADRFVPGLSPEVAGQAAAAGELLGHLDASTLADASIGLHPQDGLLVAVRLGDDRCDPRRGRRQH